MTHASNPTSRATTQLAGRFLETARQLIHAYDDEAATNKALFHKRGKALLRRIAQDMGYVPGSYDLRSNMGGIAVSGEITLHTDDLYVEFSYPSFSEDCQILYRRCEHRRDYTSDRNHFLPFRALRDYPQVIARLHAVRR